MSDTRIPLLYLAPWLVPGGADKGTIDWFRTIDRSRYELHLITTTATEQNAFMPQVEPLAAAVWNLPDLVAEADYTSFILQYIGVERIALVHIMNSQVGFDLIPDLKAFHPHVPVVVQQHAEELDGAGYIRYVANRYGHLVDAYSATSADLRDRIAGHGVDPAKIEVIYTGVDAASEWTPPARRPRAASEPLRLLYAGRIEEQKDPFLLVDVVAALHTRGVPVHVDVVGDGTLRPAMEARARAEGLAPVLSFHGVSHDMAARYAAADALIMTSRFEGIPYVIFEAMAMELPVIVPDVNANRELVDETVGWLVRPRDDVDGYVAAVESLHQRPGLGAALGRAGRRRVLEVFSLRQMAEAHERLYERLLAAALR
jgi:glycosyltransferase involved in cell wall biosynthesis